MNCKLIPLSIVIMAILSSCTSPKNQLQLDVYETSAAGNHLKQISLSGDLEPVENIELLPTEEYQQIIGFGGAFTESSAYLLNQLSPANRDSVLKAYFAKEGADYSLTRTHINSCDFSLSNYSYAPVAGDTDLKHFSIQEDKDDLIPMIKGAQAFSKDGFKILASPWTASPWMKDNNSWKSGKLLPKYYDTWALFFSKYITAYANEGIDIWGLTVENEPLGNGGNWESMHYTPEEMVDFVNQHLGPKLKADGHAVKILGYDQNRDELKEWADVMYKDEKSSEYFDGMAIHWYASTFDYMPETLQYTHQKAPNKIMIQSEACVDAEVPHWKEDQWYWAKEATDWGWDWAPEESKHLHPKYVPVYRYATDIIGCLNNWVQGWIDWNMVLNRQGGPNWANNWCVAPVIVDEKNDEVYITPLYYTMAHFSKFIRPGAVRIGFKSTDKDLMLTAAKNTDGSIALVVLNQSSEAKAFNVSLENQSANIKIDANALQTIVIK